MHWEPHQNRRGYYFSILFMKAILIIGIAVVKSGSYPKFEKRFANQNYEFFIVDPEASCLVALNLIVVSCSFGDYLCGVATLAGLSTYLGNPSKVGDCYPKPFDEKSQMLMC